LNIGGGNGGSSPAPATPPASSAKPPPAPKSSVAPASSGPAVVKPTKEFNFTSDKSKTDADAILHDTLAVADQDTIKDLYGDGGDAVDPNGNVFISFVSI
jgi:hypothetical protein